MDRRTFLQTTLAAAVAMPGVAFGGSREPLVLSRWDDGPLWEGLKVYVLHTREGMCAWPEARVRYQLGCVYYTESLDGVDVAVRTMLTLEILARQEAGEVVRAVPSSGVRPEFRGRVEEARARNLEYDRGLRERDGLTAGAFPCSQVVRHRVDMVVRGDREVLDRWDAEVPAWWCREMV